MYNFHSKTYIAIYFNLLFQKSSRLFASCLSLFSINKKITRAKLDNQVLHKYSRISKVMRCVALKYISEAMAAQGSRVG